VGAAVNRWYDPKTGRWLSENPIQADVNLYRYVGNGPTNWIDPTGFGYIPPSQIPGFPGYPPSPPSGPVTVPLPPGGPSLWPPETPGDNIVIIPPDGGGGGSIGGGGIGGGGTIDELPVVRPVPPGRLMPETPPGYYENLTQCLEPEFEKWLEVEPDPWRLIIKPGPQG
jgi:hypothetical protein